MKKNILFFGKTLALLALFPAPFLPAQTISPEVMATAGSHSNSLDWTIGEPMVTTLKVGNQQITQGFHQTNLQITAVEAPLISPLPDLTVFPNPVRDQLNISIKDPTSPIQIRIVDLNGRLLFPESTLSTNGDYALDFSMAAAGTYFLEATEVNGNSTQTFKILKIK